VGGGARFDQKFRVEPATAKVVNKLGFLPNAGSLAKRALIAMPGGARFDPKVRAERAMAKVVNELVKSVVADLDVTTNKDSYRLEKSAYYLNVMNEAYDLIRAAPDLKHVGLGNYGPTHRAVVDALAVLMDKGLIENFQVLSMLTSLPPGILQHISSQLPSEPGPAPSIAIHRSFITGVAQGYVKAPPASASASASASAPKIVDQLKKGEFDEMHATFGTQRLRLEGETIRCAWSDLTKAHSTAVGLNDPGIPAEERQHLAIQHAAAMENCRDGEKSIATNMVAYYKFYETRKSSEMLRVPPPGEHYLQPIYTAMRAVGSEGAPTQLTTRPELLFKTVYKDLLDTSKCPDDKARSTYMRRAATEFITVHDAKVKAIDHAILELDKLVGTAVDHQVAADAKELHAALKGIREDLDGQNYRDIQRFARLAQTAPGEAARMIISIGQS
jgi:hypothetical protein